MARVESKEISLYAEVGTAKDFDVYGFKKGGHAEFNVEYRRRGTRGLEELHVYVFGCDELDMYIFRSQVQRTCAEHAGLENSHALRGLPSLRWGPRVHAEHHPDKQNREVDVGGTVVRRGLGDAQDGLHLHESPGEHLARSTSSAKGVPLLLGHLDAAVVAQGYHGLVTRHDDDRDA